MSLAAIEHDLAVKRELLVRFEAIDTGGFPEQEALDRRLMKISCDLRAEIEGRASRPGRCRVDQQNGIQIGAPELPAMLSYATVKDFRDDLIARATGRCRRPSTRPSRTCAAAWPTA